jgi:hypothetical protein
MDKSWVHSSPRHGCEDHGEDKAVESSSRMRKFWFNSRKTGNGGCWNKREVIVPIFAP